MVRGRGTVAACVLSLVACTQPVPLPVTTSDSVVLRDGDDIDAIRTAYHERLRLGLGSPFRLIEIAAYDVRMDEDTRAELLSEMFERIADGETYQAVHTLPSPHQRIVEYAVAATDDPRVGELAVNLAYEVAWLEQRVTRELKYAAVCTAALLRDRALAQRDAQHLRVVARTHDLPPHALVPALRAQRVLAVEQPYYLTLDAAAQNEASRLALMFVGGVRQAAAMRGLRWPAERTTDVSSRTAERILALHRAAKKPPQSALIMAMRQSTLPFAGMDEEAFIAELARASSQAVANVAAQRGAIALRPLAQEAIGHDQVSVPSATDLFKEFGVRTTFRTDVPQAWHAYYRTQLALALADMQRVVPRLNMQALTIEFAGLDTMASHLAYHDPVARLIRLTPQSISGSLAHELGHDLDWQIARRNYGRRAAYASDYAADVAAAIARTTPREQLTIRPTEILARQFDWVVAATLAGQGRSNGMLTSVQHEWLPGHGGARPPAANVRSARAFVGMIERGVKLDGAARVAIERAILANELPVAVHAVRAIRSGVGRVPDLQTADAETKSYVETLFVAGGVMLDRMQASECGAFALKLC